MTKNMTEEERKEKYKENVREEKKKLSKYICSVMKKLREDRPHCIMGAYHFGKDGADGHWVTYIVYPQDGRACVFDSLRVANQKVYKAFEDCLKIAYKRFRKNPNSWDRRTATFAANNQDRLKIRRNFQCTKQPYGENSCGLYACEYMKVCREYSGSWKVLKEAVKPWRDMKSTRICFKRMKSDIYKFVMEKCIKEDELGDLAEDPKFEKLSSGV